MRKSLFFIILMLTILMPIAFSERETINTRKVTSGSIIQIDGIDYEVKVSRSNSVALARDNEVISLQAADCIPDGHLEVCLDSKDDNTSATFTTYDLSPVIRFAFSINTSAFLVGEERTFSFTINNSGGSVAESAFVKQEYPEKVILSDAFGCVIEGSNVVFRGYIPADDTRTCRYKVIVPEVTEDTVTSSLNYTSFNRKMSLEIADEEISSFLPFQYEISTNLENLTIGQNFSLSLNISINDSRYNMTIVYARIQEEDFLNRIFRQNEDSRLGPLEIMRGQKAAFNRTSPSSEAYFSLTGKPHNNSIELHIRYRIDHEYTSIMRYPISIIDRWMEFNISLNEKVIPGQKETIFLKVFNDNPYMIFNSPSLYMYSDIPELIIEDMRLKDRNIEKLEYVVPMVNKTKDFNFTLTITYYDQFKKKHEYIRSFNITAMKLGELKIRKSLEYKGNGSAKDAYLKVTLTNDMGIDLYDVSVREPLLGINKIINISRTQSIVVIEERIGTDGLDELKIENTTTTIVEYSIGAGPQTLIRTLEIDPLKVEEAIRAIEPEPILENKTINIPIEPERYMESGYGIWISVAAFIILSAAGFLFWRSKKSESTKVIQEDKKDEENDTDITPVPKNNSEDIRDRISQLEDEITSLLTKAEEDPSLAEEASIKEKECEELKERLKGLSS